MPHFIPPDCQNLLRGMIEVDATKRLTVRRSRWPEAALRLTFSDWPVAPVVCIGAGGYRSYRPAVAIFSVKNCLATVVQMATWLASYWLTVVVGQLTFDKR